MKTIGWSSVTYIATFFAMGWYAFPAGPPEGPVLYVGVPLALIAAVLAPGALFGAIARSGRE